MLSSNFVNKVIERIDKLDAKNLKEFTHHLAQDRELFGSILESMIEGVLVLDQEYLIKYINKPAIIMLQLNTINVLEQNLFELLPQNYPTQFIKKLLKNNNKIQGKKLNIRQTTNRTIQLSIYPFVIEKKVIGNVLILIDISSQEEEKQKLRRAETLASLTTLAAGVAHEIKNPLASLDIYAQLLERLVENINHSIKEEITEYLNVIREEIERLNQIVKDFLFTVKPAPREFDNIDIVNLINSSYTLLKPDFDKKGIKFSISANNDIQKIKGNENYLKRAFVNIFKNSIEAASSNISVFVYGNNKDINIEIKDDGNGISQENIDKMFEPYFTTKEFGTGLGLTIVYKIIKEHQGHIKLDSEQKIGTTFTIVIPTRKRSHLLLDHNNKKKQ